MARRNNGQHNQARYILTTIMCVAKDPLSYDEVKQHANAVTRELQERDVSVPLLGHRENAKRSLFRDVFAEMRNMGKVGVYHAENAVTKRSSGPDEYVLTRGGFQLLARPATDVDGLTPELAEDIRVVVADEFETGLRGFGSTGSKSEA